MCCIDKLTLSYLIYNYKSIHGSATSVYDTLCISSTKDFFKIQPLILLLNLTKEYATENPLRIAMYTNLHHYFIPSICHEWYLQLHLQCTHLQCTHCSSILHTTKQP